MKPLVSVITITKDIIKNDREHLFHECASSVLNQTYKNIEYIIQDGMSEDGTKEIIDEYKKDKIVKIYYEKDYSIDNAYNLAVSHASGKYLYFLNSDDMMYDDNVIQEAVDFLENKNADYIYGNVKVVDKNGKGLFDFKPRMENFWRDMPYSHQSFLVKKDVFYALGGHTEKYGIGGDYDFAIKLILNDYKGVYFNRYIAYYRTGGISGSDQILKKMNCIYILSSISKKLYDNFYENIDIDQCVNIYRFGDMDKKVYPDLFLDKLIRFMIQKKLLYYDTERMISYIHTLMNNGIEQKIRVTQYKLFSIIPILKIIHDKNKKKVFLFNFFPVVSVKERLQ